MIVRGKWKQLPDEVRLKNAHNYAKEWCDDPEHNVKAKAHLTMRGWCENCGEPFITVNNLRWLCDKCYWERVKYNGFPGFPNVLRSPNKLIRLDKDSLKPVVKPRKGESEATY